MSRISSKLSTLLCDPLLFCRVQVCRYVSMIRKGGTAEHAESNTAADSLTLFALAMQLLAKQSIAVCITSLSADAVHWSALMWMR